MNVISAVREMRKLSSGSSDQLEDCNFNHYEISVIFS